MKPVMQTVYGAPDGDCFQACVASILEMDLEDATHACKGDNPEWMFDLNDWLEPFGLGALTVAFQNEAPIKHGYCCACGPCGPESLKHSVVLKDFKLVHNPHEGWGELEGKPQDYTFFIVLDPALWIASTCGHCGSRKNVTAVQFRKEGSAGEYIPKKEFRCAKCRSKEAGRYRIWH